MSPYFKDSVKMIVLGVFLIGLGLYLSSCTTTENVLAGASHACGRIHVEGYFTDTQGEVIVAKAPDDWTPEQVQAFCNPE